MPKKRKVFFILNMVFLAIAVASMVFMFVVGMSLINMRNNEEANLGVAISAVALAVLSVISGAVTMGASALSGVFSALNLKAEIKWLKTTSICSFVFNVLSIPAVLVFIFCFVSQG